MRTLDLETVAKTPQHPSFFPVFVRTTQPY